MLLQYSCKTFSAELITSDIGFYIMCNGSLIWRETTPPQGPKTSLFPSSNAETANRDISTAIIGLDNKNTILTLNMTAVHPVKAARQ